MHSYLRCKNVRKIISYLFIDHFGSHFVLILYSSAASLYSLLPAVHLYRCFPYPALVVLCIKQRNNILLLTDTFIHRLNTTLTSLICNQNLTFVDIRNTWRVKYKGAIRCKSSFALICFNVHLHSLVSTNLLRTVSCVYQCRKKQSNLQID